MSSGRVRACPRCGIVRETNHSRPGSYCVQCKNDPLRPTSAWMQHGACRSEYTDPEWWWPRDVNDPNTPVALTICRDCRVRDLCLDYAIQHNEREGIWGGVGPAERARMAAAKRRTA